MDAEVKWPESVPCGSASTSKRRSPVASRLPCPRRSHQGHPGRKREAGSDSGPGQSKPRFSEVPCLAAPCPQSRSSTWSPSCDQSSSSSGSTWAPTFRKRIRFRRIGREKVVRVPRPEPSPQGHPPTPRNPKPKPLNGHGAGRIRQVGLFPLPREPRFPSFAPGTSSNS